jgi:hypothetical protein
VLIFMAVAPFARAGRSVGSPAAFAEEELVSSPMQRAGCRTRVFVAATKAKNAKNALAFLSDISKPATQLAFNKAKGSVPVLRDVDVSSLTAYADDLEDAVSKDRFPNAEARGRNVALHGRSHGERVSPVRRPSVILLRDHRARSTSTLFSPSVSIIARP